MITGALGRLLKPGPDPMTTGATFLVGLGGVVAAVIFGLLGVALLGGAGALRNPWERSSPRYSSLARSHKGVPTFPRRRRAPRRGLADFEKSRRSAAR